MKTIRSIRALSALASLMLVSGAVHAATWTYSSTGPASNSGLTATASAFSASNNTASTITATTAYYDPSGLGVKSSGEATTSPQHAIDNNGAIETVMLSFSNGAGGITSADKVNLTSASFGWVGSLNNATKDSDFSVYAYTGSSAAPTPLGVSYTNLVSNGWTLIGHYNGGSTIGTQSFSNTVYSSNWLIGAYNGLGSGTGLTTGNDYFKMASVSGGLCPTTGTLPSGCGNGGGTPGGVPEPGTLLLMGAGLLGLTRMSRRKVSQ